MGGKSNSQTLGPKSTATGKETPAIEMLGARLGCRRLPWSRQGPKPGFEVSDFGALGLACFLGFRV